MKQTTEPETMENKTQTVKGIKVTISQEFAQELGLLPIYWQDEKDNDFTLSMKALREKSFGKDLKKVNSLSRSKHDTGQLNLSSCIDRERRLFIFNRESVEDALKKSMYMPVII